MPNRLIKESINESYGLSECSIFAQDLFKRLITYADDYGRFNADVAIMKARLYPLEYYEVEDRTLEEALIELCGIRKIIFYTTSDQHSKKGIYGYFPNWGSHQRIRNSVAKCPDPEDMDVNDWYLRRFVSLDLKEQIFERDGFKCSSCGKYVTSCKDAKRFAKLGSGLYHMDTITPFEEGGRATPDNLKLMCTECSAARKKRYSANEILEEAKMYKNSASPQVAASRGELRRVAASCGLNPIQSNPIQSNARATDADNFDAEEGFNKTYELWPNRRSPAVAKQNYLHKLLDAYDKKTTALLIYNAVRLYLRDYENNHPDDEAKRYVPSFDKWLTNDCDYWITEIEKIKERANE